MIKRGSPYGTHLSYAVISSWAAWLNKNHTHVYGGFITLHAQCRSFCAHIQQQDKTHEKINHNDGPLDAALSYSWFRLNVTSVECRTRGEEVSATVGSEGPAAMTTGHLCAAWCVWRLCVCVYICLFVLAFLWNVLFQWKKGAIFSHFDMMDSVDSVDSDDACNVQNIYTAML